MNLSFDIALRYIFGKKSTNAINLITGISVFGLTIGTAALLIILSVFNGFEDLISSLFNAYSPDLKITAARGNYMAIDSQQILHISNIEGVTAISKTLEEVVLFQYKGSQEAGLIKGVDEVYQKVTQIDSTIVRGKFLTEDTRASYAIMGSGIFAKLSINPSDGLTPITVYAAMKSTSPLAKDYASLQLYPSAVFKTGGEEDGKSILTNLHAVQTLITNTLAFNALELKLDPKIKEDKVVASIRKELGDGYVIKNRYQQDEAFLKIMNIEKWISYLIACLTMALISFNLIGALWMIVLDKKRDIAVLKSMGFSSYNVKYVIILTGVLIGIIGLILGLLFAIIFYFLQKYFALIAVPPGFMIDAYPISLRAHDFLLVILTVLALSFLSSLLPAMRASKITAFVRQE